MRIAGQAVFTLIAVALAAALLVPSQSSAMGLVDNPCEPPLPTPYRLRGYVYNETGIPQEGVFVIARIVSTYNEKIAVQTDASGYYYIYIDEAVHGIFDGQQVRIFATDDVMYESVYINLDLDGAYHWTWTNMTLTKPVESIAHLARPPTGLAATDLGAMTQLQLDWQSPYVDANYNYTLFRGGVRDAKGQWRFPDPYLANTGRAPITDLVVPDETYSYLVASTYNGNELFYSIVAEGKAHDHIFPEARMVATQNLTSGVGASDVSHTLWGDTLYSYPGPSGGSGIGIQGPMGETTKLYEAGVNRRHPAELWNGSVVFASDEDGKGTPDLWQSARDGAWTRQLTDEKSESTYPLAYNESTIAYVSNPAPNFVANSEFETTMSPWVGSGWSQTWDETPYRAHVEEWTSNYSGSVRMMVQWFAGRGWPLYTQSILTGYMTTPIAFGEVISISVNHTDFIAGSIWQLKVNNALALNFISANTTATGDYVYNWTSPGNYSIGTSIQFYGRQNFNAPGKVNFHIKNITIDRPKGYSISLLYLNSMTRSCVFNTASEIGRPSLLANGSVAFPVAANGSASVMLYDVASNATYGTSRAGLDVPADLQSISFSSSLDRYIAVDGAGTLWMQAGDGTSAIYSIGDGSTVVDANLDSSNTGVVSWMDSDGDLTLSRLSIGPSPALLLPSTGPVSCSGWRNEAYGIWFHDGDWSAYEWDLATGERSAINGAPLDATYAMRPADSDILLVEVAGSGGDIWVHELSTGISSPLLATPASETCPRAPWKGEAVYYLLDGDIRAHDMATSADSLVVAGTSGFFDVDPQGARIVFLSGAPGSLQAYEIALQGGATQALPLPSGDYAGVAFTNFGQQVLAWGPAGIVLVGDGQIAIVSEAPAQGPLSAVSGVGLVYGYRSSATTFPWLAATPIGGAVGLDASLSRDNYEVISTAWNVGWTLTEGEKMTFSPAHSGLHPTSLMVADRGSNIAGFDGIISAKDDIPPVTTLTPDGPFADAGDFLWVNSSTLISIGISDADSGGYELLWGYNGTPVYAYTGPRSFGPGFHNVSHFGVDFAGNLEAVSWTHLRTDDVPPSVDSVFSGNSSSPGPDVFVTSATLVELVSNDADSGVSSLQYKLDGGAWTAYAEGFTISTEGSHALDMLAVDAVGNRRYVHRNITVDDTPPSLAVSIIGLNYSASPRYVTSLTTLSLVPEDAVSGVDASYYRIDDGAWLAWTSGFILVGEGHHNLTAVSYDAVGNLQTLVMHLFLDDTAPASDAGYDVASDEGAFVEFNASRSTDLGCGIQAYRWDFGDGSHVYQATPFANHSYAAGGTYVAVVTVWDNLGHKSSDAMTVYVHNAPPSASAASSSSTAFEGETIVFSGNASTDTSMDATELTFVWYLGDGTVKTGRWVTHAYADEGSYLATLVVTDSDGAQDGASVAVEVVNRAPVYAGPLWLNGTEGTVLSVLCGAFDWGGDTLTFTDDSPAFDADPRTGLVSFVPDEPFTGVWSFHLFIADGDGGVTTVGINVSIEDVNDAPSFSYFVIPLAVEDAVWSCQLLAFDVEGDALTFSLVAGPPGMSCAANGTMSWTPGNSDVGTASVVVLVTDSRGASALSAFAFAVANVNDVPLFERSLFTAVAVQDEMLTLRLAAADIDADPLVYYALGMPAGCAIDGQTGLLTWTPDWTRSGTYANFTVCVLDPAGTGSQSSVSIFVENVNDAPEYVGFTSLYFLEDSEYNYTLDFDDRDGDGVVASVVVGPSFIAVVNGSLVAAPGASDVGYGIAKILYTDGNASGTFTLSYVVVHVNHAPSILSIWGATGTNAVEDEPYMAFLDAEDPDGDRLEYGILNAPTGMAIDPTTGRITYTPTEGVHGTVSATFVVQDPYGAQATLTNFGFTVQAVNDAPLFDGPFEVWVTEGEDAHVQFTVTDPDSVTAIFSSTSDFIEFLAGGEAVIRYDGEAAGFDAVVSVSDGWLVASASIRVHVSGTNDAPEYLESPDGLIAVEGVQLMHAFTALDADSPVLTYRLTEGPANATMTAAGVLAWTPTWADAYASPASFVVEVSDGFASLSTDFTVVVVNAWTAPLVTYPAEMSVLVGQAVSFSISAISRDPGSVLSYSLDSGPFGAYLSGGVVHWTPSKSDAGKVHAFNFTVRSGLASAHGRMMMTVANVNSAPMIWSGPAAVIVDEGESVSIAMDWLDEDYSLGLQEAPYFSLDLAPAGMSVGQRTGVVTWTPGRADVGDVMAIVNVTDGSAYDVAFLSITVRRAGNAAPVLPQTFTVELVEGESARVHIAVTDPDGDAVTLVSDSELAAILSGTDDLLIVAGRPGISEITLTATDGEGGVANMTLLLRVAEKPDDGWSLIEILLLVLLVIVLISVCLAIVLFATAGKRGGSNPPQGDGPTQISTGGGGED